MERKRVLIDTSILIDHLRKTRKDSTLFFEIASQNKCIISSITEFEFLVGCTPQNRKFTKNLLSKLTVLPFDSLYVETAIDIFHNLKAKNKLISLPDIFIAATAIKNKIPLITLNRKHFERIDAIILDVK